MVICGVRDPAPHIHETLTILPLSVTHRGKIFKGVIRVLRNLFRVLDAIFGVLGVLAVKIESVVKGF